MSAAENVTETIVWGFGGRNRIDAYPVGLVTGIVAGIAVYDGIKEVAFPANDAYERVQHEIREDRAEAQKFSDAASLLHAAGKEAAAKDAKQVAGTYTASAEHARKDLPTGYNPHVEGGASLAGAALVGALVFKGLVGYIAKKTQEIRNRSAEGTIS